MKCGSLRSNVLVGVNSPIKSLLGIKTLLNCGTILFEGHNNFYNEEGI